MRSSLVIAASLAALARAVSVSSPSGSTIWALSPGSPDKIIQWDFVDTDPKQVDIVLVNMVGYPPFSATLASGVAITDKSFTISSKDFNPAARDGYQVNLVANGGILAQSGKFTISNAAPSSSSSTSASATSSSPTSAATGSTSQNNQGSSSSSNSNNNNGGSGGGSNTNKIALGVAIPFVVLGMSGLLWWLLKSDKAGHSHAGSIRNAFSSRASNLSRAPSAASAMSDRAPTFNSNWSAVSDPVPPYERDPFEDESSSNLMTPSSPVTRENPFSDAHYATSNLSLNAPPSHH